MKIEKLTVELTLTEPMLGTIPKNKEVYKTWIMENLREKLKKGDISQEEFNKKEVEEIESIKEIEEKSWTGFRSDEKGLFLFDYMVLGFLKAAGEALKSQVELKAIRSKIDKFVFVFPRKLYLNNGKVITEPHGVI